MARKLDLSATRIVTMNVEGVAVEVRVDANGWPLTASASKLGSRDDERLYRLVMGHAIAEAEASAKADSDATRTNNSTQKKRDQAAAHLSGKWLAAALKKNPGLGAERLALAARRLLATKPKHPDYARRAKITEYRAKQYLRARKNSGEM